MTKLEKYAVIKEYNLVKLRQRFGNLNEPVFNKKSGKPYYFDGVVINATNCDDGTAMVLYYNEGQQLFVREVNEFMEKFYKKIEDD